MTIKYKLTNGKMQTYRKFQWEIGKWYKAKGNPSQSLCTDAWFHCYDSPLLAVLHNPIHAGIKYPRLFKVGVAGVTKGDNGLKRGYQKMKLLREIPLPKITAEQKIKYAIYCALAVYKEPKFVRWAEDWLSGKDRSAGAAGAAEATVWATAGAAARAAGAAARAAGAAEAAEATVWATAWAAEAAARAAEAAAEAADINIDLPKLAEQACSDSN